jgi:hypothetical protein
MEIKSSLDLNFVWKTFSWPELQLSPLENLFNPSQLRLLEKQSPHQLSSQTIVVNIQKKLERIEISALKQSQSQH